MGMVIKLLGELGVSKFSACWMILTGGWAGFGKLISSAFTKMLKKLNCENVEKYSALALKAAICLETVIDQFVTDEKEKIAAFATTKCIRAFSRHIEDAFYSDDELAEDVGNIKLCFKEWKSVCKGHRDEEKSE